ncbi:FirrV-1-B30 precursor [Ectocarpus siliculosus]|uniref:FirrV-1-B30 n=1 Tax=Ectocarpus siliculosus TaxID=2880 RepID=D8LJC3_ECTSI|nr:FirrV-1-B30 precursor [Ectocarpus siliculosus]|eukprot:CBN79456.1 FirrV-1-B30 precursor [Ectocarpus siliculosus]
MLLLITIWRVADARTFEASPDGVPYSIASALAEAGAGDTVVLADGTYNEAIVTVQGGESGNPLIISGGRGALVNAGDDGKVVNVQHSWVTLEGFSVDGKISDDDEADSYVDKCVFVEGPSTSGEERLEGFVMQDVSVQNCGDECVRLKSFVVGAVISDNVIQDCGVRDFVYGGGGKNGEGVYVGTSSNQWSDGPDECNDNTITGNTITPNGNECVDVKEGSTGTIIEDNTCSGQLDEDSGCFGSRGDGNVFRYNTASDCLGVGVRIGGWEADGHEYGQDNSIYGNSFTRAESGGLSFFALPQGKVCGNSCQDGPCDMLGGLGDEGLESTWDQPCDDSDLSR